MKIFYTASATATGDGRDGKVRSSDGNIDLALAVPTEMGGAGGATNPEQLFASGYAACFHSALRRVAQTAKADVEGSQVTAEVGIGASGGGAFGLAVTLRVALPGVDADTAAALMARAHEVCPYSNATRGNIDVHLQLV
ncbi:Ohr subfamily peroxiredoxin [Allocatelliglobosispora scoriae]|uniref:Ohr subfamily peroxiredoxin n=1 Tax=Allocatelliglobosispora scoriae TaxID=643052 RepID=A0A841C0C6_9ACTN|nr:organic hydroperoxide resistance protein [Allocatelliglobosispora scoriae]MBB5873834.1 Ohr subfamily peroxiredoxin [Allocatelliglobosispora scoriae]